ncbi:MAG: ribosome maturation factor RimP [Acidobacteria bacterium]|nr:ribosome maturation factor RimP [Acidobacteriota bacterium]
MEKISIIEKVRRSASEIAAQKSLELVHVEVVGSDANPTVRIFIDRSGGVTHDDCSYVSTQIGEILDSADLIDTEYVLEVSSPGIERGLYSIQDFDKFAGKSAKVKTKRPIDGQRNFRGKILGVRGELIDFEDKTNGNVQFSYGDVLKANLEFDTTEELKEAKKRHLK